MGIADKHYETDLENEASEFDAAPEFLTPPDIGRIVHYTMPDGTCRPAMVIVRFGPSVANLQVHLDGMNDDRLALQMPIARRDPLGMLAWVTSVGHGEQTERHRWHWHTDH